MTDQPKPATGEWTWQHEEIYRGNTYIGCARTDSDSHDIVAEHNAALAAEREKGQTLVDALYRLAMRVLQSDFYLQAKQETDDALLLAKVGNP